MRGLYIHFMSVNFPVLILYYNYVRCNHWGKLGEVYTGPLCTIFTISCQFMNVSKKVFFLKIYNGRDDRS